MVLPLYDNAGCITLYYSQYVIFMSPLDSDMIISYKCLDMVNYSKTRAGSGVIAR